jgi:VWFA-related protein
VSASVRIALLAAGATALAASGAPQSDPSQQFPAETALVTVDVVVLDEHGSPIRDLTAQDFVIEEDAEPQQVTSFQAVEASPLTPQPDDSFPAVSTNTERPQDAARTFAVVFDATHLTPEGAQRAKPAIEEFLTRGVRAGDRVSLISTDGGTWWTARGERTRKKLLRLVEELKGGRVDTMPPGVFITDYEAVRIVEHGDPVVAGGVYRRLVTTGATYDPNARAAAAAGIPPEAQQGGDREANLSEWFRFHPEVQQYASQLYGVVQQRRRVTLQTMTRVVESLTTKPGRKSLLLVSEGFVADRRSPGFRELVEAARRANTTIYFLDARGLSAGGEDLVTGPGQVLPRGEFETAFLAQSRFDLEAESEGADSLAEGTGGFSVKNTNDLGRGFRRIQRESAAYYLLGYVPTNETRDGSYRRIRVRVGRENVEVRARKGYYAPAPEGRDTPERAGKAAEGELGPLLQRALDSPFDLAAIPLRASTYVLDAVSRSEAQVLLATEIDVNRLSFERDGDRLVDRIGFLVTVHDLESGKDSLLNETIEMRLSAESYADYSEKGYRVLRDLELPSGIYLARIVVLDHDNRRLGSVAHEFEVPDLSGWRVSTPILSDTLEDPVGEGLPRPVPLAHRHFAPRGRLFCLFRVYGAAVDGGVGEPDVVAGFSFRTATGQEIFRADPAAIRPDATGQLVRLLGIPLEGLAPGHYQLLLSFEDRVTGARYERRETLTVGVPGSLPS